MVKPVVLIIVDGFGIAPESQGNAVTLAKMKRFENYKQLYASGSLIASGESVGLPANEVGNTEVGHLTIGAGRVVFQDVVKISKAIEDRSLFDNKALIQAAAHVRKNDSKLHLMGLVSTGNVHSNITHLYALLDFAKQQSLKQVYLHVFTDGRDAPPQKGLAVVGELEQRLKKLDVGEIATVSGRYWAMDRDRRWDRTQKAYDAIAAGKGKTATSAHEAISTSYANKVTDEFIEPTVIQKGGAPVATVDDNDACIFFNFRVDRPVQLTMALTLAAFEKLHPLGGYQKPSKGHALSELELRKPEEKIEVGSTFERGKVAKNLFFVTMTEYHKSLTDVHVAFPPEQVTDSLPEVLATSGMKQLHLAESEKGRFVTYYFDGLNDGRFPGEDVQIVNSPKVATYDKKPQMSVFDIVTEFERGLAKDIYGFFVMNFANPDMVGHSGVVSAAVKACKYVDKALELVIEATLSTGGQVVVTADHGNAEEMLGYTTKSFYFTSAAGEMSTDHSNNPVPVLVISKSLAKPKDRLSGVLSDVAPTILAMLGLPKPEAMTGVDLLAAATSKATSNPVK